MQLILYLIGRYRTLVLFVVLQITSLLMVLALNRNYKAGFALFMSEYASLLTQTSNNVWSYFRLKEENAKLLNENANLHYQLTKERLNKYSALIPVRDSVVLNYYRYTPALVVNYTTYRANNFLTINKGKRDGIKPGMAVISSHGVVGRVKECSAHFSLVTTVLHSETLISAQIKRNRIMGSVKWDGKNPRFARLQHIPGYFDVLEGDSVITSGFNAAFPTGLYIGTVEEVMLKTDETFYDIGVKLGADFTNLEYVYVVKNLLTEEEEKLEEDTLTKELPERYVSTEKKKDRELKKLKEAEEKERKALEERAKKEAATNKDKKKDDEEEETPKPVTDTLKNE
ncbi:MAG TPA: rod shape-determining protein MreC [Microscillaceae bacterium]|jgi:rod shape-determining protein MreC|nr:rod shape-determining protein MreC [Microscillaceae bacterium]